MDYDFMKEHVMALEELEAAKQRLYAAKKELGDAEYDLMNVIFHVNNSARRAGILKG